jgi:hypothetical protein
MSTRGPLFLAGGADHGYDNEVGRLEEFTMNKQAFGNRSSATRRRIALAAAFALAASGIAFGAAPATSRGPATPASRPATNPAANKAAANTQYLKAKELYDAGKFAEANVENDKALALDPTHGDATLMKRVLEGKLTAGAGGAGAVAGKPGQLTPTQIALVKVGELTANEPNIRGRIDRAALEEFWNEVYIKDPLAGDTSPQTRNAFLNANPNNFPRQVQLIRESKQQKYLEKITITTDPAAIVAFRSGALAPHTYMMANCATSECHGGEKAGNFRLLPVGAGAASTEVVYTNFYIMSMYSGKDGKMIDRDSPDKSLFLQYSLPWASSPVKHPKVDIKKIPNVQDNRYRSMMEWVRNLNLPRPNYGITFEVPGAQ